MSLRRDDEAVSRRGRRVGGPLDRKGLGRFAALVTVALSAGAVASTPVHARCTTFNLGNDFVRYNCSDGRSGTAVDIGGRFTGRRTTGGSGATINVGGGITKKLYGRSTGLSQRIGGTRSTHGYGGQAGSSTNRGTKITSLDGPLFEQAQPARDSSPPSRPVGPVEIKTADAAVDSRGDDATRRGAFRTLSENGDAIARRILRDAPDTRDRSPDDDTRAIAQDPRVQRYRSAAEQGNANAEYRLGLIYDAGVMGVPRDAALALRWYRKAAEHGQPDAQHSLGFMFGSGDGVRRDYVQAHLWLTLAASTQPAGAVRDRVMENRDAIAKKLTPSQIAVARRWAKEWRARRRN